MRHFYSLLLATTMTVAVTAHNSAFAITPYGGSGSGQARPQSPAAPTMHHAQPSSAPRGALPFPETSQGMRQALFGGGNATRGMAEVDAAGFGAFIEFDSDSAAVIPTPGLYQILEALTIPPLEPNQHITITGHTDSDGDDAYNMDLSYRRANAVRSWLVSNGVQSDALRADGAGESQPIATNATGEGKRRNRRVEFSAKSW